MSVPVWDGFDLFLNPASQALHGRPTSGLLIAIKSKGGICA